MKDINHQNLISIECSQSLYMIEGAKGKMLNAFSKNGRRKGNMSSGMFGCRNYCGESGVCDSYFWTLKEEDVDASELRRLCTVVADFSVELLEGGGIFVGFAGNCGKWEVDPGRGLASE